MASTVLSGAGNVSYTNSTGQNVRVLINFMQASSTYTLSNVSVLGSPTQTSPPSLTGGATATSGLTFSWSATSGGTVSVNAPGVLAMGRNLAITTQSGLGDGITNLALTSSAHNMIPYETGAAQNTNNGLPTEIMLASGQTFSTSNCVAYNIVIIREDGG